MSPCKMRRDTPLLGPLAILSQEVLPIWVIFRKYVSHHLFISLSLYRSIERGVVDRSRLLHCLLILLWVVQQVGFNCLLHVQRQNVAILTHHLFSQPDCLNNVVLDTESYQILCIERREHLFIASKRLSILNRENILHQIQLFLSSKPICFLFGLGFLELCINLLDPFL